uniref:Uncharacterized protein n=1 Tax=Romanomermis culicivorax TaxID=13658 RepID=A0A915IAQ9_ROMCU
MQSISQNAMTSSGKTTRTSLVTTQKQATTTSIDINMATSTILIGTSVVSTGII